MMKTLLVLTCCGLLLTTIAVAGLFKDSVELADLSEVAPEALETLQATEFAVFVAQVRLSAAKTATARAEGGVKTANRTLEAEKLDLKAAEAELKAAKANQDSERIAAADAGIAGAKTDLATVKALREWKMQEQEARQAEVAMAKSAVDLAEANRDLARVRLLKQANVPSAEKYDQGEIERSVSKRQKEYDIANRKASAEIAKIEKLKIDWERLAKNGGSTETQ